MKNKDYLDIEVSEDFDDREHYRLLNKRSKRNWSDAYREYDMHRNELLEDIDPS